MMIKLMAPKFLLLFLFILSVAYTQFRGKVRLRFYRQLINHSTFMSPINAIMYLFSAVPNKPYFELNQFPELDKLKNNWEIFREEAKQLIEKGYIKAAEQNDDLGFNSFFKRGWKRFYLNWYDDFLPSAKTLCPKSVEILKNVKGINAAMFALLPRQGVLNPHRDPYAGSLRYHLGLITPNSEKCRIYVDGIPHFWKDGEDVLFDETYVHHAKNETDMDRIILFCDVERPMRNKVATIINQFFSKYILSESATKNFETDRVGKLNKLYRYYHFVASFALRIKQFNTHLYRVLQYTIVGALAYWVFF